MNSIKTELKRSKLSSRMVLQVHDELLFEVPKEELKKLTALAVREMEGAAAFKVPLSVSVKAGPNWLDMEQIN